MRFGINSLAFVSPFTDGTMDYLYRAADMGFDIFELAVEDLSSFTPAKVGKAARDAGIAIELGGAFGETRDNSSDLPEYRANGLAYIKAMIDMSEEMGCTYIAGPMYSAVGKARRVTPEQREQQMIWAAENIREAAEYAKKIPGFQLAIEPLNRFETDLINTVEQGLELIERIGMDNVGFLLDTFHMNIEEVSISDAICAAGGKIIDFHSCANNRGTPGQDHFNWPDIRDALRKVSYDGSVVIESFTPDCVEIAKAASVWRKLADSPEALAANGLAFLKNLFA